MDLAEFEVLVEPLRQKSAAVLAEHGLAIIGGWTATADEIARVELDMAVTLPDKYTAFMMRFGGGAFGFVDLLPILATPEEPDDLRTVNDLEFPDRNFVAVAPVGTGDYWGFPVVDGRCQDSVWFRFHDAGDDRPVATDFLEFVAEYGLKSSSN